VTVLAVQMIPQILVLIPRHSSLSVSEIFSDSSNDSGKITTAEQMKKTFQVETHVSDKLMYLSDYEIGLAVGVVFPVLENSTAFPS